MQAGTSHPMCNTLLFQPLLPALHVLLELSILLQSSVEPLLFHLRGSTCCSTVTVHPLPLPAYKRNLPTVSMPSFLTIQLCVCQVVWDRRASDGMAWMLGTCLMPGSCFGSAQCLVCNAKSHPNRDSSWAFRGAGKFSNILCSPSLR